MSKRQLDWKGSSSEQQRNIKNLLSKRGMTTKELLQEMGIPKNCFWFAMASLEGQGEIVTRNKCWELVDNN